LNSIYIFLMFDGMRELTIIFMSTWKFALTFPIAVYSLNNLRDILIYTNLGGLLGVLFFALLSQQLIRFWDLRIRPRLVKRVPSRTVFNRKNRRFIKIKNRYGFPGIVILNPVLLSIPISTFLVIKFFGRKKRYLAWLILGQFAWSVIYAVFYLYIKNDLLQQ
jgi:hypothetical protein